MILANSTKNDRAYRFPLKFPIYYRRMGISTWRNGDTVDISRTGVLFRAKENLHPEMKLEIRIPFPGQSTLTCQGTVVRNESSISTGTITGVAVRMIHCRLLSAEESQKPAI